MNVQNFANEMDKAAALDPADAAAIRALSNTTRKAGHQGISPGTGLPPEQTGNQLPRCLRNRDNGPAAASRRAAPRRARSPGRR